MAVLSALVLFQTIVFKMKNLYKILTFVFVFLTLSIGQKLRAQCTIAVTQSVTNVCAGSPVTLRARLVNINAGTGANGSISVSSTYHTDSIRSAVSGNNASGTNTITVASATGFAVGQEVLIITMTDPATTGNLVGQYEFATIASITSNTLTLTQNKVNTYNASATVKHQVVRVPQYQNVTVVSGGILTCNAWDGTTGGVLAFRSNGNVVINSGGQITTQARGYRGVSHAATWRNKDGGQGEGIYGLGFAGANSNGNNGTWNNANGNGGGGGTGMQDAGGGGGGGYANVGTAGIANGSHAGGTGGIVLGSTNLTRYYMGGAGGEGGADEDGGNPGKGGNGGGIIFISAVNITANGTINSSGETGGNGAGGSGCGMGGGGGGAGGTIHIQSTSFSGSGSNIVSTGGNGGAPNGCGGSGGAGSVGRIRYDINGTLPVTNPVAFQGTFPAITGTSTYTWSTSATTDSIVVSPTSTTTYSVTGINTNAGCTSSTNYQLVVTPLPANPITINGSRCSSGPVTLSASSTTPGTTIRWYSSATGGTPIGYGSPFNTPSISSTTTFYAEAIPLALPGDSLSSLRLAVGLRKLKSNYTGNAIKLRRSSDNATQIFGFSGNELDTVAIKTWLGTATAFVEIVYDQSGFGNDVSQTSIGNQPTLVLSGHNGKPVLRFNTSQYLFNNVNFPTPFSVVTGSRATGASNRVFGGRNNNWLHGYYANARNQFHYNGWNFNGNVTTNMTLPYIYSGTGNGSTETKVYENGTLLSNVSGGYQGPNGIVLNGWGNWGESSNADIFEIFIYNEVINDNARAFVESSTSDRFNVPVSNYVTSGSGCVSASRIAAVATISTNAFSLPDSVFGCGDSVLVSADTGYTTYSWNGGGTTRTKWIKTAGWATCTVTGGPCGGTQADSVFVNLITNKIAQNDTAICAGVSKQLSVVSNLTSIQGQGSLCGTANEGGSVTLTAPAGSVFTAINFASYGTPNGSCGSFTTSGCHATNSLQIVQAACVGNSTCTVLADNSVFGDPCGGTVKRLYIQATYGSTVSNVGKVLWSNGDTNKTITVTPSTSTTYYCTSTLNGRTCTDSIRITVNPKPTATISPSGTTSICSGDSITFTTTTGTGLTYQWLRNGSVIAGATNSTFKTTTAASYRVVVTNATGCRDTSATTVASVATKPTATATAASATTFCNGGSVVINANTGTGLTYQWLRNNTPIASATNASYTADTTGSYRVLVSNTSGCSDTSTAVSVTENAIPTITSSTPASRCGTGTVNLTAAASAGTINWYAAATGGTSLATGTSFTTPSISSTTTYYVDATANGCTTATRTAVAATVNTIPTITSSTPASRCGTGTVNLTAAASAGTINWYAAATGGTSLATGTSFTTPSISSTTTYYVDATATGCTTATRTAVTATVNALPTATATAAGSTTLCTGGSVVINANTGTGLTYQWLNNNAPIASATNASYTANAAGSYRVLVTNANSCSDTSTAVAVVVNAIPTITSSTPASRCGTGTVNLTAAASAGTINWYAAATGGTSLATGTSFTTPSISSTTTYYVDATANGCTTATRTAVAATVNALPTATATAAGSTTLCTGGSVVINANTGTGLTYQWLNNNAPIASATNASYTANAAGSYRVLVTNANSCRDTSTAVAVVVNAIPTITSSTPASRCGTGTVNLTAAASAGTINWYAAATGGTSLATGTSFTTPSISSTTTYYVDATANGCTNATRTAVAATVNAIPTITSSTPASRCGTGTVNLTAAASAGTINWYAAATGGTSLATGTSFTTPSISSTTTYYVDATATGCTTATRTAVTATVNALPTATATAAGSTTLCTGGSVVINANTGTGLTYQWLNNNAPIASATNASYTANAAGSYRVLVTNANSCSDTSTAVAVVVNAIPTITSSTPASRCGTGTVNLTAAASAGTINWYAAATGGTSLATGTSFTTPSISSTTTYYVDATANGCTTATRTAVTATVNPNLTASVSVSSNTTSICGSAPITFTATPTNGGLTPSYQWKRNGVNVGTNSDTYVLNNALNGDSVYVVLTSNATPCLVNTTANSNGIKLTSSTVTPAVAVTANPGNVICNGTSVTFTANATNGGSTPAYQWRRNGVNVGTNSSTFITSSLSTNDSISVVLTSNASCLSTPTATSLPVVMTVNTIPTITSSTPASRCGTGTVNLTAAASAGTINWYAAATGGTSLATGTSFTTPSIATTTTYYVDATANGCTTATRTAVAATVNTIPTITSSTPASRCGTGTVNLTAAASAGTINWYAAATGGTSLATGTSFTTPSIATTTTYYVDATANGCTTATRTAVTATVNAVPSIIGVTPASRCGAGTVNLTATASAGNIDWYTTATGGTSLGTGTSYTTPSLNATTTYFVEATANGCTTATRTSIAATVNAKPITSAIIGRTSVHSDTVETYSVTNTTGSSYVWTVIGGVKLTGGTTNSITVDWDVAYTAGMVKVVETNTLGCQGDTVFKPIVSIVPVEFLSFDAKRMNDKVNLTWVTASEINNSHFEVERSIDNSKFENIGTVKGNGTTSMMNTYKLTDNISKLMNSNATTLYYRLKQVDFDGEFAYTEVRTVELNKLDAIELTVYPNPNYGDFNLSVRSTESTSTTFIIFNNLGAEVWSYTTTLNEGLNTIPVQLQLAKGMYNVNMISAKGTQTQRFVVK
jgi:uncharacterized membrane protein